MQGLSTERQEHRGDTQGQVGQGGNSRITTGKRGAMRSRLPDVRREDGRDKGVL